METHRSERLVHEGRDPSDTWIVTGIGHSKVNLENVYIQDVASIAEYEAGCKDHDNCEGHLCRSPYGPLLPMQSLAISTAVMRNDISKAAGAAFEGSSKYYAKMSRSILQDSLKTKTGRMRKGILNCHVDGSLRMVITPQVIDKANVVMLPRYLEGKWTVVYLDTETNRYKERTVAEGDRALAIRPPSLSISSVQPVVIKFWDGTCMGISQYLLKAFAGDYDGDEMHLLPVYSPDAVAECDARNNTPNHSSDKAMEMFSKSNIPPEFRGNGMFDYMYSTTMTFEEMRIGADQPIMSEQTRTRIEHINGFRRRYDTSMVSETFIEESIRGMGDTNTQQLSQPIVGDRSRIAKLAAGCVVHKENGMICVATTSGYDEIIEFPLDVQAGSSSMRGASTICAGVQQVTLQSHHAKEKAMETHDIVSDMLIGTPNTLVVISTDLTERKIQFALKPQWVVRRDDGYYVVCATERLSSIPRHYIVSSHNPIVLSYVSPDRRIEVCRGSIERVSRYYGFSLSPTEIMCLSVLFSYRVEASKYPITTRDGIKARKLRWTETMMANSYKDMASGIDDKGLVPTPIDTISACLMAGNFREID